MQIKASQWRNKILLQQQVRLCSFVWGEDRKLHVACSRFYIYTFLIRASAFVERFCVSCCAGSNTVFFSNHCRWNEWGKKPYVEEGVYLKENESKHKSKVSWKHKFKTHWRITLVKHSFTSSHFAIKMAITPHSQLFSQQSQLDSKFKCLFTASVIVTEKSGLNTKNKNKTERWRLISLSFTKTMWDLWVTGGKRDVLYTALMPLKWEITRTET